MRGGNRGRFENNPRLYGHTRAQRTNNRRLIEARNQLSNLRELRNNMMQFDSMLDEIDNFQ